MSAGSPQRSYSSRSRLDEMRMSIDGDGVLTSERVAMS